MLLVQLAALTGLVASAVATTTPSEPLRRRVFSKHHQRSDSPYHQHDPHAARSLAIRAAAPSQQPSAPCTAGFEKVNGACVSCLSLLRADGAADVCGGCLQGAQDTGAVACTASSTTPIVADSFSSPSWTKRVTNGEGSVETIDGVSYFFVSSTGDGTSATLSYAVPPFPAGAAPSVLSFTIILGPGSSFGTLTVTIVDTSARRTKRAINVTTFCGADPTSCNGVPAISAGPTGGAFQVNIPFQPSSPITTFSASFVPVVGTVAMSPPTFQNPTTPINRSSVSATPPPIDLAALAEKQAAAAAAQAESAAAKARCAAKGQNVFVRNFCTTSPTGSIECIVQRQKRQRTAGDCSGCVDSRATYDASVDQCVCRPPYSAVEGATQPGTCTSTSYCAARGQGSAGASAQCTGCLDPNAVISTDNTCICNPATGWSLRGGISLPVTLGDCVNTLCTRQNRQQAVGVCGDCVPNSTYAGRLGTCVCNDHFTMINGVCVPFTDSPVCISNGRVTSSAGVCGGCVDPARTIDPTTQACTLSTACEARRVRTNPDLTCSTACKDVEELPNASGVCDRSIRASCVAAGRTTNSDFSCSQICIDSANRAYNSATQACDRNLACFLRSRNTLPDFTCGQICYFGLTNFPDQSKAVNANGDCTDLVICRQRGRTTIPAGAGGSCGGCINPDEGRPLNYDSNCGKSPACEGWGRRTQPDYSCGTCKDAMLAVGPSGACELSAVCVAAGRATLTATTCGGCTNPSLVLNSSTQSCESPVCASANRQTNVSTGTCGSCLTGIEQDGNGACTLSSACVAAGRATVAGGGGCGACTTQGRVLNPSTGNCDLLQTCQDQGRLTSSSFTCTTCIDPALQVDGATGRCTIRTSCETAGRETEQTSGYACGACKAGRTTPSNNENGTCSLSVICNSTGRTTLDPSLPGVSGCGGCSSIRFSLDGNGACSINVSCSSLNREPLDSNDPEYFYGCAGCTVMGNMPYGNGFCAGGA